MSRLFNHSVIRLLHRTVAGVVAMWALGAAAAPVFVNFNGVAGGDGSIAFNLDQPLDLDGDGTGDLSFELMTVSTIDVPISSLSTQIWLVPLNGAGVLPGGYSLLGAAPSGLAAGATVPPITALSAEGGYQSGIFWVFNEWANLATGASGSSTPFGAAVADVFVPFALPAGDDWRYGYLHLDYSGSASDARAAGKIYPSIAGWVYESQPGVMLQVAGATAIPEPSTVAVWMAVAAALVVWRRRR